jgi:hypothetical protein
MRRTFLQTIAYLVLIPGLALAGQISGRLTVDAHPVQEGVKVAVICGDSIKGSTTDRFGSYRLYQPITGECTLQVYFGAKPATSAVASYPDPVTFDFELVKNSGNTYQLRRR